MPALEQLEGDPTAAHAALRREHGPVAWVEALGAWLVLGRAEGLAVLRDAATYTVDDPRFTTARVVGRSMLSTDGAEHAVHRAPFARAFRLAAVREGLGPRVTAEAARLVAALDHADRPAGRPARAELRGAFCAPLAARIAADALGLHALATHAVLAHYAAIVAAVTDATAGRDLDGTGEAAAADLREAMRPALHDDPAHGGLAAARAHGGLDDEALLANAAVLLFGGIETTEGMLLNALVHLLADPPALARARASDDDLRLAVEESLRLEPAAATLDRYATRDVDLAGVRVRAGDLVTISVRAANRDPAAFAEPDRFDLDRPEARLHVAFAAGPHVCLGMHLARLEAHVGLRALLDATPGLQADPAHPAAVPRGLVFRRPTALHVRWEPAAATG